MNFEKLKNDFKIRYDSISDIPCTFAGAPFFLLGDANAFCKGISLSISLSSGTAIAINTHSKKDFFSVQEIQDNTLYSCKVNELHAYHEQNYASKLFHLTDLILKSAGISVSGADILLSHSTVSPYFHNSFGALLSVFALLFPDIDLTNKVSEIPDENYANMITSLISKKEHCIIADSAKKAFKDYLFPIAGKKIIIALTDAKNLHFSLILKKVSEKINLSFNLKNDIDEFNSKEINALFHFMKNEESRIAHYPNIRTFNELCEIINSSGEELLSISASEELYTLTEILKNSGSYAARPLLDGFGAYCIADDTAVDSITEAAASEYEKKAGYKPAFYIVDTESSGTNFGLV